MKYPISFYIFHNLSVFKLFKLCLFIHISSNIFTINALHKALLRIVGIIYNIENIYAAADVVVVVINLLS